MRIKIKNSELRIKNWLLLFCILHSAFCINKAYGQEVVSSPYSRYGIGDIAESGFSRNLGMGGLGIGVASPYNLNIINPASYSTLSLTTFEGALRGNATGLNSSDGSSTSSSVTFGYFAFGMPFKANKWGFSFGLLPYSSVGYNISDNEPNNDVGSVDYTYQGSGGINQFYMGTGYSLFKNLHVGVNAAYLFGTINQVRTLVLPDQLNYFNTQITDQTSVGDFHFTFGMQFNKDSLKISPSDSIVMIRRRMATINKQKDALKKILVREEKRSSATPDSMKSKVTAIRDSISSLDKQIEEQKKLKSHVVKRKAKRDWAFNLGGTLSLATDVNASKSSLTQTYINDAGVITVKDTAQDIESEKGFIRLPLTIGFGFSIKKGTQWLFGADVEAQNWSSYQSFGLTDSLVNSIRYSVGAQYTPNDRSIRSYWDVVQYRLGFHYGQTYLRLDNTNLNDYAVSIGLGFPVKRAASVLQFSFEVGKMGTLVNQLVEINYFRFTVGITLNDIWFLKPRID